MSAAAYALCHGAISHAAPFSCLFGAAMLLCRCFMPSLAIEPRIFAMPPSFDDYHFAAAFLHDYFAATPR